MHEYGQTGYAGHDKDVPPGPRHLLMWPNIKDGRDAAESINNYLSNNASEENLKQSVSV